ALLQVRYRIVRRERRDFNPLPFPLGRNILVNPHPASLNACLDHGRAPEGRFVRLDFITFRISREQASSGQPPRASGRGRRGTTSRPPAPASGSTSPASSPPEARR